MINLVRVLAEFMLMKKIGAMRLKLKRKFFLELQKSLEGWGCSIEEAIKSVKMNVTDFMQHGFDFNDF